MKDTTNKLDKTEQRAKSSVSPYVSNRNDNTNNNQNNCDNNSEFNIDIFKRLNDITTTDNSPVSYRASNLIINEADINLNFNNDPNKNKIPINNQNFNNNNNTDTNQQAADLNDPSKINCKFCKFLFPLIKKKSKSNKLELH